jgi:hypothetical protein
MVHGKIPNLKFLSPFDSCQRRIVPESARLGNALDTTRHVSIVEVLGVFMSYFALHRVVGRRSIAFVNCWLSVSPQRTFGRAARLMGLMQPEPGPITPRVLLEAAIGNQKPCHQTLALPTCTSCFRSEISAVAILSPSSCQSRHHYLHSIDLTFSLSATWTNASVFSIKLCCKKAVVRAQYVKAF